MLEDDSEKIDLTQVVLKFRNFSNSIHRQATRIEKLLILLIRLLKKFFFFYLRLGFTRSSPFGHLMVTRNETRGLFL